jgi:acyl-CoA reductase-like NAD-dependent aldehyde dehydrogenase
VADPFAMELICDVANCGPQDAQIVGDFHNFLIIKKFLKIQAVAAARKAFPRWANEFTAKERGAVLEKCFDIMKAKEAQLAELLTKEQAKFLIFKNFLISYMRF